MIEHTTLTSADGFVFNAIAAKPKGEPIGGVVVAQEIFGLTDHIADMCGVFADAGYAVLAPSLYDRFEPNFIASHDAEGIDKGRAAVMATKWKTVTADVQACIDALPQPVYVTGFCYGGAVAWNAAARCTGVKAVSCFYGRMIVDMLEPKPAAPVMLHYGARDASIPPENYETVRLAAPDSPLYLYDAGHGFCRAGSHDYYAPSRDLAVARTLDWFARWR
ncbi:MAG: dienelactone hydrolase family protein [Hyphomonadaceae bacterium]